MDYLRSRAVLLILDNFEQVADASMLVSDLIAACRRLKLLITSRFVLRLSGEQEFQVPPLRMPDVARLPSLDRLGDFDAIRLFASRAQAARPDFSLDATNAPIVAAICHRLDGLPLAIELAAARVRVLSPRAILTHLDTPSSSLNLLEAGPGDVPARQKTLRNTIAWSYDLLALPERILLNRLSAFVEGWTLEAAEAVCSSEDAGSVEVLAGLDELVAKNLARQIEQSDGTSRFQLPETIREYVLERNGSSAESAIARQRHADYYLTVIRGHEALLFGPERNDWLERLHQEYGNIWAAVEWSKARDGAQEAVRMAAGLLWYWRFGGNASDVRPGIDDVLIPARTSPATPTVPAERRMLPNRSLPRRMAVVFLAKVAVPSGLLWWLLSNPRANLLFAVPREHFVIVTTVAFLSLVVALLVARVTVQIRHYRALFLALGFMMMAGFFTVHALATPGVLADENAPGYGGTGGSVIEFSTFMSIFIPSILFAAGCTSVGARFKLERRFPFWPGALVVTLLVMLGLYATVALAHAEWFTAVALGKPPSSYLLAVLSALLLLFAAWRQARLYLATHLSLPAAFVLAFLLLGIAQVSMILGPVWTLAWWEYHLLMYLAVLVSLGTLLLELRRGQPLRQILEGALDLHRDDGLNVENLDTVAALITATELKDPQSRGHAFRVAKLVAAIGREMKVPDTELRPMARAALLHDIGHLAIPDAVLLKRGPLTAEEWITMKQHADHGLDILAGFGEFPREIEVIAAHHERMDGRGYLRQLSEEAIPLGSRILAVADTYEALLMDRPFRLARSPEEARRVIREESVSHLDVAAVAALFVVLDRRGIATDKFDDG